MSPFLSCPIFWLKCPFSYANIPKIRYSFQEKGLRQVTDTCAGYPALSLTVHPQWLALVLRNRFLPPPWRFHRSKSWAECRAWERNTHSNKAYVIWSSQNPTGGLGEVEKYCILDLVVIICICQTVPSGRCLTYWHGNHARRRLVYC